MDFVLDLDLDFFVWPIAHERSGDLRLPDAECEHLFSEEEVRQFLEKRCGLSREVKIPGVQIVEHEDAFTVWRRWLSEGKIRAPFTVVHVDAHSDFGAGVNLTCHYIETELLARPLTDRSQPPFGAAGLNSGNYLIFAIGNRWVGRLTYVYPIDPRPAEERDRANPGMAEFEKVSAWLRGIEDDDGAWPPVSDLPDWCFRGYDWRTGIIELAEREHQQFGLTKPVPLHVEPGVPFELRSSCDFQFSGFTHMILAQSPQYTPAVADLLLPIVGEYFEPA